MDGLQAFQEKFSASQVCRSSLSRSLLSPYPVSLSESNIPLPDMLMLYVASDVIIPAL